jgi:lipase (class 3)
VRIEERTAPTLAALRPLKQPRTPTFPVYDDLAGRLAAAAEHPDDTAAHVSAVCAGYAYSDADTVAMIMTRLGLAGNRCRMIAQNVDAMLIACTAFVVQSADGRVVVLCYRGTVPTSTISWLTDFDIDQQRVAIDLPGADEPVEVHGGFYRNVRATRPQVVGTLARAAAGESILDEDHGTRVEPMQALYLCGHSYGAAMAALMAIMLRTDSAYERFARALRAVYAFGAPMVGSPALARACNQDPFLGTRVLRYIYERDVVAQLPPAAAGDFAHFGRQFELRRGRAGGTESRDPRGQLHNLLDVIGAPLSFLARQVRLTRDLQFRASLYDHFPFGYITALTPDGVRSEFGD